MTVRHSKLTPEAMLSAPRREPGVPNADGSFVLFQVSTYSFFKHEKSSEIRLLDVSKDESTLIENDVNATSPVWLDEQAIAFLRSTGKGETELIVGNARHHDFKKR